MKHSTQISVVVLLVVGGIASGYYTNHLLKRSSQIDTTKNSQLSQQQSHRPDFQLPDLDGNQRAIDNWNGQVIMVNFWATWCPPCRREMPAFIRLYEDYKDRGFVILGIAIDDPQSVKDFVDPMGVTYPVLLGEEAGINISTAYGNRLGALPFTVFIDRDGRMITSRRTELSYQQAEALIKPLL